mmetsp:Transcript_59522/g.141964  ORF Transcript_59522/g.141964 Transcript_59522/m.141964 type:complete len:286 (-) Transcript_59522:83-940(-)
MFPLPPQQLGLLRHVETVMAQGPLFTQALQLACHRHFSKLYHGGAVALHCEAAIRDKIPLPVQGKHDFCLLGGVDDHHAGLPLVGKQAAPKFRTAPPSRQPGGIVAGKSRAGMNKLGHQCKEQICCFHIRRNALHRQGSFGSGLCFVHSVLSGCDLWDGPPVQKHETAGNLLARPAGDFAIRVEGSQPGEWRCRGHIHLHLQLAVNEPPHRLPENLQLTSRLVRVPSTQPLVGHEDGEHSGLPLVQQSPLCQDVVGLRGAGHQQEVGHLHQVHGVLAGVHMSSTS